ncbi:hypothetical protein [Geofilum rhodophaeum]|uniref:hypothetical protein n=1 Tax=Geofilum rhodophaeum TaxID=1965019 RepID=UPI000B527536|nr:hypothetical protein [Geofilum rhodophaeum]
MQTVTIELTNSASLKALQDLQDKQLIRIVADSPANTYALPGEPISEAGFIEWIAYTEDSPTVSLTQAKQRWASQKKKLRKYTR